MFWSSNLCKQLMESCGTFVPASPISIDCVHKRPKRCCWTSVSNNLKEMNVGKTRPVGNLLKWSQWIEFLMHCPWSSLWIEKVNEIVSNLVQELSFWTFSPFDIRFIISRPPFTHFPPLSTLCWCSVQSVNTFSGASSVIRLVQCTFPVKSWFCDKFPS